MQLISEKIGGLPMLSSIWDHGPVTAAAILFLVDFGAICLLMSLEGIAPWRRGQYKSFLIGDSVFLPLWAAMVVVVLENAPALTGFYTKQWWHIACLLGAFAASVLMAVIAVRNGEFTLAQEFSPSKIWHTIIFGIVGYWLSSTFIPIMITRGAVWAFAGTIVAALGFFACVYYDTQHPPSRVHASGTWYPWRWSL